jgi:hypothetical protein
MAAPLAEWSSFYTVTGTSAAALTGLMFVVISLVAGMERMRRSPEGVGTFSTPTVVHFCAALLVSATLLAPWRELLLPAIAVGLTGVAGVVYAARVARRAKRMSHYDADWEDWLSYAILPFVAYGTILGGAIALCGDSHHALFAVGGAVLLLTFVGIHNSWDVVTFLVTRDAQDSE